MLRKLPCYTPVKQVAHSLSVQPDLRDELLQEAVIHCTRACLHSPPQPDSYCLQGCRFFLLDYLRHGRSLDALKRSRLQAQSAVRDDPDSVVTAAAEAQATSDETESILIVLTMKFQLIAASWALGFAVFAPGCTCPTNEVRHASLSEASMQRAAPDWLSETNAQATLLAEMESYRTNAESLVSGARELRSLEDKADFHFALAGQNKLYLVRSKGARVPSSAVVAIDELEDCVRARQLGPAASLVLVMFPSVGGPAAPGADILLGAAREIDKVLASAGVHRRVYGCVYGGAFYKLDSARADY